jgi:hypothetical protein
MSFGTKTSNAFATPSATGTGPPHPRVLHVVWGEDISRGGLFDQQVAQVLRALVPHVHVELLVGIPLPTLLWRHEQDVVGSLRQRLGSIDAKLAGLREAGIAVWKCWLPAALGFNSPWWALPFYSAFHVRFLRRLIERRGIDAVHARSYHAAWLAWLARRGNARSFRLVFDPRSLFVEEGVLRGNYHERGPSFLAWKQIERRLLRDSDMVLTVSDRVSEHYRAIEPGVRLRRIRPVVQTDAFDVPRPKRSGPPVWIYSGTLAAGNPWYSLDVIERLMRLGLQAFDRQLGLRILTTTEPASIAAALRSRGLSNVSAGSAVGSGQIAAELARADCGLLPLVTPTTPLSRLVHGTIIGTKTGEYLAAGLPIICHGEHSEAARLISQQRVGVVVTSDTSAALAELTALRDQLPTVQARCVVSAREFQLTTIVDTYLALYRTAT